MRAKRKCPGAITELIVINATAHTQDGCPKLTEGKIFAEQRTAGSKEVNRHGLSSAGNATPRSQRSSGDIMKDRVDIPRDGLGLTTEIFSAKCSQAQLLALFIEGFSNLHVDPSQPKPWYIELPYQSCPPELETLFRYTTSSSTLAFFGMITMDQAVQEEARRSYGLGLAYLRRELLQAQHKAKSWDEDKRFDYLRVLCSASMLLCGYELLQPSDTNTWFSHCMGSASLMEAIGSEACQEGFMHQVFHIVRFGVVSNPM